LGDLSLHIFQTGAGKKETSIGQGVIDWKEFFAAAKTDGVQDFFVEMTWINLKTAQHILTGLINSAPGYIACLAFNSKYLLIELMVSCSGGVSIEIIPYC
jgi:hypothetical protein